MYGKNKTRTDNLQLYVFNRRNFDMYDVYKKYSFKEHIFGMSNNIVMGLFKRMNNSKITI